MFTQCYLCETVFRVSAEALRAASGQVRCGRCGEVFSALTRLTEEASGFTQGESIYELEARAAALLENVAVAEPEPEVEAENGPEIARLEIAAPVDESDELEASMEFSVPPGDLDRVFVEPSTSVVQALGPAEFTDPAALLGDVRPRNRLRAAAWIMVGILLVALLIAQLMHFNADWLSPKRAATVSAYELRQWGVTGDPAVPGTLRVRASIMNTAAELLPYPMLRVVLSDRFGKKVAEREFEPPEYLGKPTTHLLAPGERVDATLDILDPGKDAESFEIDVCVRNASGPPVCAGDAGAAAT